MKAYRPSNKVSFSGFQWLIWTSLLGGLTIGSITFVLSQFVYVFFLFPLAMGGLGGKILTYGIQKGKVRNPLVASLFAGVSGFLIYGSLFWGNYWLSKQIFPEFLSSSEQETVKNLGKNFDEYLQETTGKPGFFGYVKYSAQEAVVIRELLDGDFTLNEPLTWLYWLIELSIIEWLIITLSYSAAKEPFCEACESWYSQPNRVGNVKSRLSQDFLALIQDENYFKAAELVKANSPLYSPSLEVEFQRCPCCQTSDVIMKLSRVKLYSQGELTLKPIQFGIISQRQAQQFIEWVNPESLGQPGDGVSILSAERATVENSDQFLAHGLQTMQIEEIVQQLAKSRGIKTAYFLQKKVQTLPEKPLYILGVVRRRPLGYEPDIADIKLVHQLYDEMELPEQTLIVALNKNKTLEKKMQQIPGSIIYKS